MSLDEIPHDIPTSARVYGWYLGGKDNYEVDRQFAMANLPAFPEALDITRANRLFLYRVVRHLVQEAGIRQFIDMGCGLPTGNNVHEVAQRFAPDARVVYVDIDPIVLIHARALLAGNGSTTVIPADMRDQDGVLDHEDTRRLIDFDEPLAVLFLSVGHHLPDADDPQRVLRTILDRAAPGSRLAFSQVVTENTARGADLQARMTAAGIPWQTRSRAEVDALFTGLTPVAPGLVDVDDWRPDPSQPPLEPAPVELETFLGASKLNRDFREYGGVLAPA
ncbi:SAM-dependent methyltransferase [Actinomadura chokoriensis]|uniref:SAM-dependent methyltransferase n=1 Tax=Actinomadura chokoriensis TaxID=454156 RepID=A0ABV4R228_9ACTN